MAKQNIKNTAGQNDQNHETEDQLIPLVGITQAQLDEWKAQYGEVSIVTVHIDDNESVTGYFKKPTRAVLANVVNLQYANKTYEAREFLVNNTFIGGDKKITTDFDCAQACQSKLWASVNFLKAEVTKY